MTEESADALVEFRADDVFEPAGLGLRFRILDGEGVFEKALRQSMPADDVARALASERGELRFAVLKRNQT